MDKLLKIILSWKHFYNLPWYTFNPKKSGLEYYYIEQGGTFEQFYEKRFW
jgi:hypothetical protein